MFISSIDRCSLLWALFYRTSKRHNGDLDCLGKEFTKYFPGINTEDALIAISRNPFKCVVETIPEDIQENFLKLVHDSFAKDEFQILSLSDFWAKMYWVYPIVSKRVLKIIIPFIINLSMWIWIFKPTRDQNKVSKQIRGGRWPDLYFSKYHRSRG